MYPTFMAEFEELVEEIPGVPLLVGDFNVNVQSDNNSSERQYNRTGLTVHQDRYKYERNQLHI